MPNPPSRRHVVVDFETTGTELHHQVTEAAWFDLGTREHDSFFVPHTLDGADPVALEISRYHDRISGQPVDDGTKTRAMWHRLGGDGAKVTIWGANAGFDQRFAMGMFARAGLSQHPFHHRVLDPCSAAYWMCPSQFPFGETPGLKDVADFLGIDLPNHHEALADVLATVPIIEKMIEIREQKTHARPKVAR